ncbi:similar to Saccharomyces cerevisiae YOL149W DCP1 Subunit of the Dcp1p-Dcp2p decapping enzyme complex, which removes the 5' cap structure from mRNAs prior to their degradation [Maudiozyma barnettii]|uniref:Similar to Saccharomyces cerevisiae YOL149W DCP1 Subunit of the Dcp1p-Dcp2p decapping enzyme complex, which removes the 5' cap structure from mRNAs prior to their degradation n=1 Tax=Maudiozyma barnettii TaxID=61262 RepID=A0A8H2ZGI7_9SACH|nr:similar to Saccharomyces cerevisiae YOL149W DCP1 Subunit of the Dcp1p-Dcp2p decapping enzyme complex, which removes the 5' cap structure from mRNAs prior to their degradation [Kazachstania barnettii]CAB4253482.1 similar to Saccharomyces cerevisiae YOL149W DCP1 Subunit of the Dcp1p-Dcp2p decapping enzyme complex, which removes the 5' cap structure from mRNAs prior to their degradation [Kazachstania barnettii]CAD1781156.1 similar to Saccharomyces cerevisiae YOL149W DCP1 Subunit of the Dcp1p-Dcp2
MTKQQRSNNNNETDNSSALEFYRKALNFNVIGRYDPKIKQLLFHTPHASIYKWDFQKDEWTKLEYQGVLAIYLRDISDNEPLLHLDYNTDSQFNNNKNNNIFESSRSNISEMSNSSALDGSTKSQRTDVYSSNNTAGPNSSSTILCGKDIYNYGLIILNRMNPDNFSMGIAPNSVINKRKVFDVIENKANPLECMGVEVKDDLVIIKNLKHEVFGIWIHTIADRQNIYQLIKYLLESEPKESFA